MKTNHHQNIFVGDYFGRKFDTKILYLVRAKNKSTSKKKMEKSSIALKRDGKCTEMAILGDFSPRNTCKRSHNSI